MVLRRLQRVWAQYQQQLVQKPLRTQVVTSAILWAAGDGVAQQVDMAMSRRRAKRALNSDTADRLACEASAPADAVEQALFAHKFSHLPKEKHPRVQGGAFAEPSGVGGNTGRVSSPPQVDFARIGTTGLFGAAFVGPVGHYWYAWLEHFVKLNLKLRPKSTPFLVSKLALDTFIFGPVHLIAFFSWTGLVSGHPLEQIRRDVARDFVPAFLTEATVWPVIQFANFRYVPVQHQLLFVNFFCLIDSAWLSWLKYEQDAPWKKALLRIFPGSSHH